jgi:hypothetical protein
MDKRETALMDALEAIRQTAEKLKSFYDSCTSDEAPDDFTWPEINYMQHVAAQLKAATAQLGETQLTII